MKKKRWHKVLGIIAIIVATAGVLILILWQVGVDVPGKVENCSWIVNPEVRQECYLSDDSAQTLQRAVENNQPELCQDVEHIFIPHDVSTDIRKGMIGTFVKGDEVVTQCEMYVEIGHVPRGG